MELNYGEKTYSTIMTGDYIDSYFNSSKKYFPFIHF